MTAEDAARRIEKHLSAARTKPLREVLKGEAFRPAGSPVWRIATEDARFDKQRGICVVPNRAFPQDTLTDDVRGLGHLVCEMTER